MGNDNSILIVVVLAVVAFLFLSKKDETPEKDIAAQKRAASICEGKTGLGRFLCETGVWITGAQAPTAIPDAAHSPQTPAPTPERCPWDASMLIGDRRCGTQRIEYPTTPTECISGEYYLDVPTGMFQRCP